MLRPPHAGRGWFCLHDSPQRFVVDGCIGTMVTNVAPRRGGAEMSELRPPRNRAPGLLESGARYGLSKMGGHPSQASWLAGKSSPNDPWNFGPRAGWATAPTGRQRRSLGAKRHRQRWSGAQSAGPPRVISVPGLRPRCRLGTRSSTAAMSPKDSIPRNTAATQTKASIRTRRGALPTRQRSVSARRSMTDNWGQLAGARRQPVCVLDRRRVRQRVPSARLRGFAGRTG